MSAQHTPGPWIADGYDVRQAGRGTRMIAYTGPHHTPPQEYPKSCRMIDEANARLIAAAPDMLEAIEYQLDLNKWIESADCESPFFEETLTMRLNTANDYFTAAIVKVKGEKQ